MNFSAISDIHVKSNSSKEYRLLLDFLKNEKVVSSSAIYFLGDIFDLMIGNHQGYLRHYEEFFLALENLIKKGIKIHYLEGNHDFHIKALFRRFIQVRNLDSNYLFVHDKKYSEMIEGKKFLFAHGDEFVLEKPPWLIYRYVIKSRVVSFIANNLVTYNFLQKIGNRMSSWSRKRNHDRKHNERSYEATLHFFRDYLERVETVSSYDYVILGHSHLQDYFVSSKGMQYYNIGDPRKTMSFLHFNSQGQTHFHSILNFDRERYK